MSRVHDALRKAEQLLDAPESELTPASGEEARSLAVSDEPELPEPAAAIEIPPVNGKVSGAISRHETQLQHVEWRGLLSRCATIPFQPVPEAHLINVERPHEVPGEEFRTLRTRLNHMQTQQDLHSIVVTSASPAEGKTFTAVNLALAQAQLELPVLMVDLDLRRPVVHNLFQCDKTPGFSDFLLAERKLEECVRRIEGTNLYFLPAGTQVRNPLELLNMRQVKQALDAFRKYFHWVILDTPPLLFSADANLLATLTDGTLIVVRIGSTTYDTVIRAMQSLCENNVLGIVANGAQAGELYSKYTYYYTKSDDEGPAPGAQSAEIEEEIEDE
jgi:receptor protein-tyrosine kinase